MAKQKSINGRQVKEKIKGSLVGEDKGGLVREKIKGSLVGEDKGVAW